MLGGVALELEIAIPQHITHDDIRSAQGLVNIAHVLKETNARFQLG